ncbi:Aerobic C4-dicarboxylate transporter [Klebsiella pneumoniae subsp. rhinoscleromatis]|nr:Aerobic C4-dicarboxylate transporter [Klebsiella pneumoniae subsp. rhinoscleromatis]
MIPTGYSFNLDGTSIYLTMAAVFIAQATNSHMDIFHQITLLVVLLLSSKGAAGVTGQRLHRAGGDHLGRRSFTGGWSGADPRYRPLYVRKPARWTNLVGNGVATVVVAKWGERTGCQTDG